jgi:hypothetical protein
MPCPYCGGLDYRKNTREGRECCGCSHPVTEEWFDKPTARAPCPYLRPVEEIKIQNTYEDEVNNLASSFDLLAKTIGETVINTFQFEKMLEKLNAALG